MNLENKINIIKTKLLELENRLERNQSIIDNANETFIEAQELLIRLK